MPQTLSLPLYPLYSRTAHFSPGRFGEVYSQSLKFFIVFSIPFAAFFIAWAQPLLLALGKSFCPPCPRWNVSVSAWFHSFSTLFQYLFAALDEQKKFLVPRACVGPAHPSPRRSHLQISFVGPSIAFVASEIVMVGFWIVQLTRLGYPAHFASLIWRPLAAGAAMSLVLYQCVNRQSSGRWQARLSRCLYALVSLL